MSTDYQRIVEKKVFLHGAGLRGSQHERQPGEGASIFKLIRSEKNLYDSVYFTINSPISGKYVCIISFNIGAVRGLCLNAVI